MTRATSTTILQALRRLVEDQHAQELPDQDLLRQFTADRDEAAFLALMRRHGPMVLTICRALLPSEADAEDAFQAAFLVFARKARSIRKGASLGSWLHGVAYRTAHKAQAAFASRHKHERAAARQESSPPDDLSWREVQQVLHEELRGLSERNRAPLTLCYLQGKTLDEAAGQLGLSKSTLKTRLERARELLRARLARRGLGPNVALLVAVMPAAMAVASGQAAAGVTSARVAALTEGVLHAMLVTRRKFVTAALAALAIVGVSLAGLLYSTRAQQPAEEEAARVVAPVRAPKEVAVLRGHANSVWSVALTPDGRTLVSGSFDKTVKVWDVAAGKERLTLRGHPRAVEFVVVAADGKTVASADQRGVIQVWDLPAGRARTTFRNAEGRPRSLFLTPDGRTLTAGWHFRVKQWDLARGRELASLKFPEASRPMVTPDGKAAARNEHGVNPTTVRLFDLPSGRERAAWRQNDDSAKPLTFSPDGKTLFTLGGRAGGIQLLEVATGKVRATTQTIDQSHIDVAAIHPHGRILAIPREDVRAIRLIDLATGESCAELKVDNDDILSIAFSADGNRLAASEGPDSAIRVWDVGGFVKARPPLKDKLSERDLEALWADLAGDDAARAYRAVWALSGAPKLAAPWLTRRLPPVVGADEKVTAPLLAGLDHDRQAERDQAMRQLEDLGEAAWPALESALAAKPSAEVRRRVEGLLAMLERAERSAEHLRVVRAVEALELAGTPEPWKALERLAGGLPQALRTREARAALDRLSVRAKGGYP